MSLQIKYDNIIPLHVPQVSLCMLVGWHTNLVSISQLPQFYVLIWHQCWCQTSDDIHLSS